MEVTVCKIHFYEECHVNIKLILAHAFMMGLLSQL